MRNLLATLGRRAAAAAMVEQKMLWHDGQECARPRPVHAADLDLVDEHANSIYLDVRVTHRPVGKDLMQWVESHERAKRKEYGLAVHTAPAAIHDSVRPYVLEAHGRMGDCAATLTEVLCKRAAQRLVSTSGMAWSVALESVRLSFLRPLSVLLCKSRWQCWAECCGTSVDGPGPLLPEGAS